MLTRIYNPKSEDSFTLIELLIVIIIIGILAAIALPIFLNQQKSAKDASVQSDVRNTVTAVQTTLTTSGGNVTAEQSATATNGTATDTTGSYIQNGGKIVDSRGDTIIVNIHPGGSYQVIGYRDKGDATRYTDPGHAYTFDSTTGKFTDSSSTSTSTTATPASTTCTNDPTQCYVNFDDGTNYGTWWSTSIGGDTGSGLTTTRASTGTESVVSRFTPSYPQASIGFTWYGAALNGNYNITFDYYIEGDVTTNPTICYSNSSWSSASPSQCVTLTARGQWAQANLTASNLPVSGSNDELYMSGQATGNSGSGGIYIDTVNITQM